MNYIFFDFETSGLNPFCDQILTASAIKVDKDLNILKEYKKNCRLKKDTVPHPKALLVNGIRVENIIDKGPSYFEMISEINNQFDEWTPSIYTGYNNIAYDCEILRSACFKNFLYPFITSSRGNKHLDILLLNRSMYSFAPNILPTPISDENNPTFGLEEFCKVNQIPHNAHDARGDVLATIEVAKLMKNKAKNFWDAATMNITKETITKFIHNEDCVVHSESINKKLYTFVSVLVCLHPIYGQDQCYLLDLKEDPTYLFDLNTSDLKQAISSSPKKLRTCKTNKTPVILSKDFVKDLSEYLEIGEEELIKRANLVKKNHSFCAKVRDIILEDYKEYQKKNKANLKLKPPEDKMRMYETIFSSTQEDQKLATHFRNIDWNERAKIYKKFKSTVYQYMARNFIYEEAPDVLSQKELKTIKKEIAEKLLTLEKKPWNTFPEAFREIDELREEVDEKQMKFINDYDKFLQSLQKQHEKNL